MLWSSLTAAIARADVAGRCMLEAKWAEWKRQATYEPALSCKALCTGRLACEGLVGNEVVWHILSSQLDWSFAVGQRVRLGKEVAHELVVV